MNLKWAISIGLLAMLSWPAYAADLGEGRISYIQGEAQVQPVGSNEWQVAAVNVPLRNGDRFWCPEDARMELEFQDGSVIRLDNKSELDVLALDDKTQQFHLSMGRLYYVSSQMPTKTTQVDLPDASLVVLNRARFRVDVAPDGGEEFSIFQGSVQVAASGNKTQVRTGEMLSLENGSSEVSPLKAADDWEQWNLARDRQYLGTGESAGYLPPEMSAYASDLYADGDWTLVPDYGYCWAPRVAIGWAPYRFGHWVWIDGDWVWISFEPWGWAPYHFGRWAFFSNRWCWVPPRHHEVRWGPGFVGWIHTGRFVGWVPLAPGEHFRRGEINRGEFHNLPFHNSTTIVERGTFASGRVVPITPRENIFAPARHSVGFPDIQPVGRAMRIGPVAAWDRLPSRETRSLSVPQLRAQHPALNVVPPQSQMRTFGVGGGEGFSNQGRATAPQYMHAQPQGASPAFRQPHAAAGARPLWGNRTPQRMWWTSPKSSGGHTTRSEGNGNGQRGGGGGGGRGGRR